ncbi:three component ABC system middle component [Chitinophaga filiformis]|uniref:Uncharacterized protein n=1 Tax=Chitinophaga filiformis TaxID=104663 RepID=A0A1G8E9V5_CHIFI|nr:three component ABC system middle component [Chitinophaga filiformis]SDH66683.1 hypothetical protein SAMN04488121_11749 [Chitinophaga filiformis]
MLPTWENRPEITANLINPAFCSEIIRECAIAFKNEAKDSLPFSLAVLVLPLILNSRIRERLPKSKSNTIHAWINDNEDIKIGLAKHIKSFLPFSRESIMFGIAHNTLSIDDNGGVDIKVRKGKLKLDDLEIKSCISKATTLGKVFSKSGNPLTIYSILGIKP